MSLAIPKLREGSYFPDWLLTARRRAERAMVAVVALGPWLPPRAQEPPGIVDSQRRRILRRGIPYSPQLLDTASAEDLERDRGLLFLCAQSNIEKQFQFIQQTWANDPNFPVGPQPPVGGYNPSPGEPADGSDPIIGQHQGQGVDTLRRNGQPNQELALAKQFVITRGGEYFFTPSITTLRT